MDLISVLMPVYNVERYVEEAAESILSQTYKELELIIVDDCSTDGTYAVLEKIAGRDKRVHLYRNEQNFKICKTLNFAWSKAKGKYIARMDGDDVSLPNRLEVLKQYLDTHPQCSLVGSGMITIDEDGNEMSCPGFIKESAYINKYMGFRSCIPHIWLAKREVYDVLNGYRDMPYVEDYDFLLRAIRYGYNLANVDDYIYKCRIRTGNTGSTNGLAQHKAKRYVTKLWKQEKKKNEDLFSRNDYLKAINSTEAQKKSFQKARDHLNYAIHHKDKKVAMVVHTIIAMISSRELFLYIIDSTLIRIGILEERLKEKRNESSNGGK